MAKKLIKFLFSFLVIILIIDPADKLFHLKSPLFLLIIFVWFILKIKNTINYKTDSILMICGFLTIAIIGFFVAIFQNSEIDYAFAIGFFKSLSILFLIFIIIDLNIEADSFLNKYSILIPLITIPIYFISINFPISFSFLYDFLVLEKQVALIANRQFFGYDIFSVYYKTSSILVFPLSYYSNNFFIKKKGFLSFLLVALFFICLLMSGTRANIIAAVLVVLYYLYQYLKLKKNVVYNIISIISVFFIFFYIFLSLSFGEKEESSEIKSGHFTSFISNIEHNPQYLIWGQGLGSTAYSSGTNSFQAQTELTYFDLIRFFGIPLTCMFIFLVIYPLIYLYKNKMINKRNKYSIIAFSTYLFIAGTNPLLISSTGMLILIVMYSFTNKKIYA